MAERYDYDLDETLNLYLDGRLSGEKLEAFERRMQSDPKLRRAVEFHRGLTLDLREETPSLPPGYAGRAQARLRADAGAARESRRLFWFSSPGSLRILATAGVMLVVALVLWPVARRAMSPTSDALDFPDSIDRGAAVGQEPAQPDEETLEALRSLGYISSGGGGVDEKDAQPVDVIADKVSGSAAVENPSKAELPGIAAGRERPSDGVAKERAALSDEEIKQVPAGALLLARKGKSKGDDPAGDGMAFQVLSVGRAPGLGRDHEVIAADGAWLALFEGSRDGPPVIDFTRERAVLLQEALGSDPTARLNVDTVTVQAGILVITCRVERPEASADETFGPGQVVLVPAGDLPIRIVILP